MNTAGLIVNDSPHYLDHLAPFCAERKWPLIIVEPSIAQLARLYYPGLEVLEQNFRSLKLPTNIVSCHPRPFLQSCFPSASLNTFWLPHGNSDKGWKSEVFELLRHEKNIFVYGPKMVDAIKEKNGGAPHLQVETVHNYRKNYFTKHLDFYRMLTTKKFPKNPRTLTLFYAPTWKDSEDSCSFFRAFPILADHLPENYTLLIKLHPNTELSSAPDIERLIGKYAKNSRILWVRDFPPIYPLLEISDGYIGDMSSIGYDFLSRNLPMYFLNHQERDLSRDPGLYLHRCGLSLKPEEYANLFDLDQKTRAEDDGRFGKIRREVYRYTFG